MGGLKMTFNYKKQNKARREKDKLVGGKWRERETEREKEKKKRQ